MPQFISEYIWIISDSPYSSPFLSGSKEFGTINPCFLIDQYSGKRPAIINKKFLKCRQIEFPICPSALLDSNLVDQVYAIANGGKAKDGFKYLLEFLTEKCWDFSLCFYYVEHFCKAKNHEEFVENAIKRTHALLTIHSMNELEFLHSGKILPNPEAVENYLNLSGAHDLNEVASQRVEEFSSNFSKRYILDLIEAIEIALIKMFLLRRVEMTKATPLKQHEAFVAFLKRDLGITLARESHLALHYFYDQAGRLFGIQPNTPINKALATINSTAWDMYLLRMPELLFSSQPPDLFLSFIATEEKQLGHLAKLFSVESISGTSKGNLLPDIGYLLNELPKEAEDALQQDVFQHRCVLHTERKSVPVGLHDAMVNELRRVLPGT